MNGDVKKCLWCGGVDRRMVHVSVMFPGTVWGVDLCVGHGQELVNLLVRRELSELSHGLWERCKGWLVRRLTK